MHKYKKGQKKGLYSYFQWVIIRLANRAQALPALLFDNLRSYPVLLPCVSAVFEQAREKVSKRKTRAHNHKSCRLFHGIGKQAVFTISLLKGVFKMWVKNLLKAAEVVCELFPDLCVESVRQIDFTHFIVFKMSNGKRLVFDTEQGVLKENI